MQRRCGRDRTGFTLIELLVVIAIIAILAAILFPIFVKAKEQGRKVECLSRLKDIGTAFSLYIDVWDSTMPSAGNAPQNNLIRRPLQNQLKQYLKVSKTHHGFIQVGNPGVKGDTQMLEVFFCPSFPETWRGQHFWYMEAGTYQTVCYDAITRTDIALEDQQYPARKHNECLAIWNRRVQVGKTETRINPPKMGASGAQLMYCSFGGHFNLGPDEYYYPHNNGSNCLYLDFHVKWHRDKSSITL